MIECANPDCDIMFEPGKHNQKYHNEECCKVVTSARLMANYHRNKEIKSGKHRLCKLCKSTRLSRYNNGDICQSCIAARRTAEREEILNMLFGQTVI